MAFSRIFDGKATLKELERACETMEMVKMANLLSIQGRDAELPDGTKLKVNVAQFDPKNHRRDILDDLELVKKADADQAFLQRMAAEGRAAIGGDMIVFIEDQSDTILVFGKTTPSP